MQPNKDEIAKFTRDIEDFVSKTKYSYLEAVVEYCNETGLEIEIASKLISPNLKSKIEGDALDNNMLKDKIARLPI